MKQALEHGSGLLPSDAPPAKVLQPCNGALDCPTPLVAGQHSSILGLGAVGTVGSDHVDSPSRHLLIELVIIIGQLPQRLVGDIA